MDWILARRCRYAGACSGGVDTKMNVYLYTGVYSIPPGKNITLFPGKITYVKHTIDGTPEYRDWACATVNDTHLKGRSLRLQSAKPAKNTRNISCVFVDDAGNRQGFTFEVKGCGKASVFGHHRRLTVELLEYPAAGKGSGKARSYLSHANVPLRGNQLAHGLQKLLSNWLNTLFSSVGKEFLSDDYMLDVLAKEEALKRCKAKGDIALNWNPLAMDETIPADIRGDLNMLAEERSSYRLASLTGTIMRFLTSSESENRISLESLVKGHVLPCYPVFNVSPYGPRVWDEDRRVSFVGVYQKNDDCNTNRANYNLCRRLAELTGAECTMEELAKAIENPVIAGAQARDVYQHINVQGNSLYFLGITDSKIRKEKQCTQS